MVFTSSLVFREITYFLCIDRNLLTMFLILLYWSSSLMCMLVLLFSTIFEQQIINAWPLKLIILKIIDKVNLSFCLLCVYLNRPYWWLSGKINLSDNGIKWYNKWPMLCSMLTPLWFSHVYSLCPNIPTEDLKIISPSTHQMITNDGQSLEIAGRWILTFNEHFKDHWVRVASVVY